MTPRPTLRHRVFCTKVIFKFRSELDQKSLCELSNHHKFRESLRIIRNRRSQISRRAFEFSEYGPKERRSQHHVAKQADHRAAPETFTIVPKLVSIPSESQYRYLKDSTPSAIMHLRPAEPSDFSATASMSVDAFWNDELYAYKNIWREQYPEHFRYSFLRQHRLRYWSAGYMFHVAVTDEADKEHDEGGKVVGYAIWQRRGTSEAAKHWQKQTWRACKPFLVEHGGN